MDLRQYLQAIRKFWWIVLLPVVIAGALGALSASREVPLYQSSVTFFVRTSGEDSANGQFAADQFAQRRVNSYVALLSTDRLARGIVERAGVDISPAEVSGMISASGDVNTVLLNATVTSSSEELVTQLGNAMAIEFVLLVDQVENATGDQAGVSLELVSGPTVSTVPSKSTMKVGLFVVVGLGVGVGLALLLNLRDTSIRHDDQIEELGGGPVIGRIPKERRTNDAPLAIGQDAVQRSEAYRQLRTNLQFIDVGHPVQVLVVTSALPGEGKSTTAANLALAMAAAGRKTLVIEGDLRRPKLADYFGVERAVGLTDVIAGRARIEDVLQPWGTEGLVVLPSGHVPPNPSELLGSPAMEHLLTWFRDQFDVIVLDTPPLLPVTDAAVVAAKADGTVIVVRQGKSTKHQTEQALQMLQTVGARLVGTVMSFATTGKGSSYEHYGYESTAAPSTAREVSFNGAATKIPDLPAIEDSSPATRAGRRQAGAQAKESEPAPPWSGRSR